MALTRKKITVKSKKGKTYQRSVMVKADKAAACKAAALNSLTTAGNREPTTAQKLLARVTGVFSKKKQAGVLHSMHPEQEHHFDTHTLSKRDDKYTPGPGSDHSLLALAVGSYARKYKYRRDDNEGRDTAANAKLIRHHLGAAITYREMPHTPRNTLYMAERERSTDESVARWGNQAMVNASFGIHAERRSGDRLRALADAFGVPAGHVTHARPRMLGK